MNTAAVLVENLIQGMQTLGWMLLLLFSFADDSAINVFLAQQNITAISVLALALCYWLGIVVDTAYYNLFIQRFEEKWSKELTDGGPTLSVLVFTCITKNSDLSRLFLERQYHLRMLRVSAVNILFLTISGLLFLSVHGHSTLSLIVVATCGLILLLLTAYAWRKLYEYYISMAKIAYQVLSAAKSETLANSQLQGDAAPAPRA